MNTLKSIQNKAVAVGSALALTIGIAFAVNAMDKNEGKQTTENKVQTSYTFEYSGPDFSKANVEEESNWTYTDNTDMCSGANQKPCKIRVSSSFVDNSGTTPVLQPATNISAALYTPANTHYVNGIADASGSISNRPN